MEKKILILMPTVPFPPLGADEQNRIGLIKLIKELGFSVSVLAKTKKEAATAEHEASYGVSLSTVPYRSRSEKTFGYYVARLLNPFRWDGAADEYFDPRMEAAVRSELAEERPAFVLIEYSFLWPLARVCRQRGIPVIVRSHNFEPLHFLSEDGITIVNLLKFFPKLLTEYMSCAIADVVFALTPHEAKQYRRLGCATEKLRVLHSGALPYLLEKQHTAVERAPIELLFMGSRYTIPHNLRAARFLLDEVIPLVEKRYPGVFRWNISGGKLPQTLAERLPSSASYRGYVDDMESLFAGIDAVISPHIAGHGMQLKVFEPLCRGIPVVTSESVLGGYAFSDGKEILFARSVHEFAEAVGELTKLDSRRELGDNAHMRSRELFSKEHTRTILRDALVQIGAL